MYESDNLSEISTSFLNGAKSVFWILAIPEVFLIFYVSGIGFFGPSIFFAISLLAYLLTKSQLPRFIKAGNVIPNEVSGAKLIGKVISASYIFVFSLVFVTLYLMLVSN